MAVGHWLAQEKRLDGSCIQDRAPEGSVVLDVEAHDLTEAKAPWSFEVTRDGNRFKSCSGVVSEDRCHVELTCKGKANGARVEYTIALDLTRSGALSGSSIFVLTSNAAEKCRARFDLRGEMVSPLQLEERK